jgi:DNA-binding NtrC family response regulator
MSRILIVDDEQSILDTLSMALEYEKFSVDTCLNGITALRKASQNSYDIIFLDIKMPKMDGLEVLDKLMEMKTGAEVIMISGHGTIETAVESTKKGAYYFVEKPFDLEGLKITIKNALDYKKSKDEIKKLKEDLIESNKLIGISEGLNNVLNLIEKYSATDSNVLILGESGTGKSLVANQIHLRSNRSEMPYITINCANLNEENVISELFGNYSDDVVNKFGKLVEAKGGTIFFDEVTNLSLEVQSMLLKVIDENKFSVPGMSEEIKINIRFLFSTNKDLLLKIEENKFREDLYHRMNVLNIKIPALRERTEDIEELISYFTNQICKIYSLKIKKFSKSAVDVLKSLRFPGNVRELRNLTERLIYTVDKNIIDAEDINIPASKHTKFINDLINRNMSLNDFQNESEKIFIEKMLNDYKYNISQTAEALQIQRSHLYKLMNKYDIPLPSKLSH